MKTKVIIICALLIPALCASPATDGTQINFALSNLALFFIASLISIIASATLLYLTNPLTLDKQ